MCFSANMSLGAGAILTVIGVATIIKTQKPSHLVFASIPLIFAAQQVAEGLLWLTLPIPSMEVEQKFLTYTFLVFAQIIWPLWVPLALMLLEKNKKRREIQKILVGIGMIVSFYLGYCLLTNHVQAKIVGYHIMYIQDYPAALRSIGGVFYFAATVIPLFVSQIKRVWILGVTILISYLIAAVFYDHYVLSVWCFFASIISGFIYYIMVKIKNSETSVVVHSSFRHFNGGYAP